MVLIIFSFYNLLFKKIIGGELDLIPLNKYRSESTERFIFVFYFGAILKYVNINQNINVEPRTHIKKRGVTEKPYE